MFPFTTKVPSFLISPLPSSKSKSTTSTLNFRVALLPLLTLPPWSSETLNVTVLIPSSALAATFPLIVAVPWLVSTAPVFEIVGPPFKVTPDGNPLSYLRFTLPLVSLSYIDNGIFSVAPLKIRIVLGADSFSLKVTVALSAGLVIFTVGATLSVTLNVTGIVFGLGP